MLKNKMKSAVLVEDNIYEANNIQSPFVLGLLKPKIFIPAGLASREYEYIIYHEKTHIRRRDHIIKFAAYITLCLHWFNPLAWTAFLLMGVDMEMSCDEHVLKEIGTETKADYSRSLLAMAAGRHIIGGSPLAFSEGGLKTRVKNVLKYKKTPWIIGIAAVALTAALSVGLILNRADSTVEDGGENIQETTQAIAEPLAAVEDFDENVVSGEEEHMTKSSELREAIMTAGFEEALFSSDITETTVALSIYDNTWRGAVVYVDLDIADEDILPYSLIQIIAGIIRETIPEIRNENIIISDNFSFSYPVGDNDAEVLSWVILTTW
jgi:hypothetical protein